MLHKALRRGRLSKEQYERRLPPLRDELLAVADVLRPLEHHVLEQVREAGQAFALVARADVVSDVQRDHRRGMIFGQLYAQAVLQRRLGEFDMNLGDAGLGRLRGVRRARDDETQANTQGPIHKPWLPVETAP